MCWQECKGNAEKIVGTILIVHSSFVNVQQPLSFGHDASVRCFCWTVNCPHQRERTRLCDQLTRSQVLMDSKYREISLSSGKSIYTNKQLVIFHSGETPANTLFRFLFGW